MARVMLVHWNEAEAKERLALLRAAGHEPMREKLEMSAIRRWKENPPAAVVIDLSRLPSHGRDVAVFIRGQKATRSIPLVFVEGEALKIARVRKTLPDAVFTTWKKIGPGLARAIARPPKSPVVPASNLAGYSGTPLTKKLGILAGTTVALPGAPKGFEKMLTGLPEGVRFTKTVRGKPAMIVWFVRSKAELRGKVRAMGKAFTGKGGLWIAWPKKASGVATDVSETEVRAIGLASGLVDFKICAIDATWSGLRFSRRVSA